MAQHTEPPAMIDALRRELASIFGTQSASYSTLEASLASVGATLAAPEPDPDAVRQSLDAFEDVLEALMRDAGWPTATA